MLQRRYVPTSLVSDIGSLKRVYHILRIGCTVIERCFEDADTGSKLFLQVVPEIV